MAETDPRIELRRWLDADESRSQATLARTLEVSQPSVSEWFSGRTRPAPHLREALELLTGIPAASWQTEEERELVARIRAQVADGAADDSRTSQEHAA